MCNRRAHTIGFSRNSASASDTPLQLRQISVTPWSGLQLSGITIPQEGQLEGNFLQAQTFQLRVQFWSLFSDRLVIRQVSLLKPEVVWAQNSSGQWRLPELPPKKRLPPARSASARPRLCNRLPPAASTSAPVAAVAPNEPVFAETPAPVFTPEVQRVKLKDGNFTFLDSVREADREIRRARFSFQFSHRHDDHGQCQR